MATHSCFLSFVELASSHTDVFFSRYTLCIIHIFGLAALTGHTRANANAHEQKCSLARKRNIEPYANERRMA